MVGVGNCPALLSRGKEHDRPLAGGPRGEMRLKTVDLNDPASGLLGVNLRRRGFGSERVVFGKLISCASVCGHKAFRRASKLS